MTIPAHIRRQNGLSQNTDVEFVMDGDKIVLRATDGLTRGERMVARLRRAGTRNLDLTTDALMELTAVLGTMWRISRWCVSRPVVSFRNEPTLVDANVVLDVISENEVWKSWSGDALAWAAERWPIVITLIVYSEVAARFEFVDELDALLDDVGLARAEIPWTAGFLASRSHGLYRQRGGARSSTLPDFFIGAHAAVRRWPLLTRDARRFRTYFPTVELIAPGDA